MPEERGVMIIGGEKSILRNDDTGGKRMQGVNRGGRYRVTNSTTLKCIHSSSATGYLDGHGNQPRGPPFSVLYYVPIAVALKIALERDSVLEKKKRIIGR